MRFIQLLLIVLFAVNAYCAEGDDVSMLETMREKVYIYSDKSYNVITETWSIPLNATTKDELATYIQSYNPHFSTFMKLEGKVITNGKESDVPEELIEDKSFFHEQWGSGRKFRIQFPGLEVGSQRYLKTTAMHYPPGKNLFLAVYVFSNDGVIDEAHEIEIESEIALQLNVRDPENALEVSNFRKNDRYVVKIKQIKSVSLEKKSESKSNFFDFSNKTYVSVSNTENCEGCDKFAFQIFSTKEY